MATQCSVSEAAEDEPGAPPAAVSQSSELEYDFVEEPDQDCYCPVSLEIMLEPYLTSCCGHHISRQAVTRLANMPCPMCKEPNLTAQVDKYFKRKTINKLKVYCPHKKSHCQWSGELGNLNAHTTACPKQPWKCQYCGLETIWEIGTKEHTPQCSQYPLPCPNKCEAGTVPRAEAESHLLLCPLQPVECELAGAGCQVRVARRDLEHHMRDYAQQHLATTTLLNLSLTRELHQKMEENKRELHQKIEENKRELRQKMEENKRELHQKMEENKRELQQKMEENKRELHQDMEEKDKQIEELKQQLKILQDQLTAKFEKAVAETDSKLKEQNEMFDQNQTKVMKTLSTMIRSIRFGSHEFTLTNFKQHQTKRNNDSWYSEPFYSHPGGVHLQLNIDTNGFGDAEGTHLTAYLKKIEGRNDDSLKWPVRLTVEMEMLNQRGDHTHFVRRETVRIKGSNNGHCIIGAHEFFPLSELGYDAAKDTEYLKDNKIQFRLWLKPH